MGYLAVAVAVVVGIGLLLVAPRLRLFDDRRWRAALVAVAFVVLPVTFVAANRVVQSRAETASVRVGREMYAAMDSSTIEDLRADKLGIGPTVVPVPHVLVDEDGGVTAYAPVRYAWVGWCVAGHMSAGGRVEIDRRRGGCP